MKKRIHLDVLPVTKWIVLAVIAFTSVAMTGCKDDDDDPIDTRSYTISGNASGSQVVPTVTATGSGTIDGTYNPNTKVLTYTSTWSGLTGPPTTAGFYSGASGAAGTAVGTPWTIETTATGTGTTSGTMTLTTEQAAQLIAGNWFYSYGTAANAGGEIRGQISAER